MQTIKKGSYGYIDSHRKAQMLKTLLLFALPLSIFAIGFVTTGTKNNYFTIIAVVGCLPACKELVNVIMFWKRRSMPRELYEEIESHAGGLETAYELVITTYEKAYPLHSVVFCGNEAAGYTTRRDVEAEKVENHIASVFRQNGLEIYVKIFKDLSGFLERVDALAAEERQALPFGEDERYPGMSREQVARELLLTLSI